MPHRSSLGLRFLVVAAAASPVFAAGRVVAQDVGPGKPITMFNRGPFRIAEQARAPLHRLWESSLSAKEERAACLGGYVDNGVVYVTRVELLTPAHADSANISATASLRECAPPQWFGTVHTHIATFQGLPYAIFSAPDRYVMRLWMERWKQHGVFCILFTDTDANCEYGYALSARLPYAYARGNNVLF